MLAPKVCWRLTSNSQGSSCIVGLPHIGGEKMHQKRAKGDQKGANGNQKKVKSESTGDQNTLKNRSSEKVTKKVRSRAAKWSIY